jgi:diguanylate cyclase (GGDEF)-like protein
MSFVPVKNRDDPASPTAPADGALDTRAILTAAGEVAYRWDIARDVLTWDDNAVAVLGLAPERIATGRGFASLLDPHNRASRQDAIVNSKIEDDGAGVRYEVQYALLPDGVRGQRVMVEDVGRWYADGNSRAARAEGVVRVITERYEREQRLMFLSRYDELTGYLNRSSLLSLLGNALNGAAKSNAAFAFMIVAVDNFRAINEAYGFEVADQVFAGVAERIKGSLREGDTIGRFSGNKLGVVLRNCDIDEQPAAATRFQAVARDGVIATGAASVAVTVSIGGVVLPRHGRTVSEAVARAQEALHLARLKGHGHAAVYTPSSERSERRNDNAAASAELVAGLSENHFILGYQPVVVTATRAFAYSEALLRIRNPATREAVAGDFVTRAERLGLIRLIDERTVELVFAALERTPQAKLAFNISGETVGDDAWLAKFAGRLQGKRALANRLIVEITETALVQNADEAVRFVAAIKGLGCAVAIDDFGAGYTSFKSLKDLKVDILKIDGSYIENLARSPEDQAFVRALTELAKALRIPTVAERVEDEDSAALLKAWGVDYLQGHLIGEAMIADRPPVA